MLSSFSFVLAYSTELIWVLGLMKADSNCLLRMFAIFSLSLKSFPFLQAFEYQLEFIVCNSHRQKAV